ncbi:Ger(x)C family spore germination C-terminal domain-containing protein [Neobacillus pocheonensis]|uniref:Ger(x)C family spore germination C-terminal domain-containing protein n=1 Tax=Neobacillus pocheonensis TaxID=363869 RepID=UPI003D2856B9
MSLLYNKGKYAVSLDVPETTLLLVLKNEKRHDVTMTLPILPPEKENNLFHQNQLSFDASQVKTKIKAGYKQNKFHFDMNVKMNINIVEQLFPEDSLKKAELQKRIEKELQRQFEGLIKKIQKHKIDPIGLGLYARAYQYDHYKKVESNWGEELAKSSVNVSVKIDINSTGAVK